MKIRFVGERPRDVAAPGRHFTVHPGGEYEVPDRLGAAMCEQRWFEPVDQATAEPAPEPATEEPQKPARATRRESTR